MEDSSHETHKIPGAPFSCVGFVVKSLKVPPPVVSAGTNLRISSISDVKSA